MTTPISLFAPTDFVFIDNDQRPYFVRQHSAPGDGQRWLYYWHDGQKGWVMLRPIGSEAEYEHFKHKALPRFQAELYFKR